MTNSTVFAFCVSNTYVPENGVADLIVQAGPGGPAQDTVVSFSDGSATIPGTFTPATVTIPAGSDAPIYLTYTPKWSAITSANYFTLTATAPGLTTAGSFSSKVSVFNTPVLTMGTSFDSNGKPIISVDGSTASGLAISLTRYTNLTVAGTNVTGWGSVPYTDSGVSDGQYFYLASVFNSNATNGDPTIGTTRLLTVGAAASADTYSMTASTATITAGGTTTLSFAANAGGPAADTTVTLADGNAGGTFNPATVVIPKGSVATVTSVYTSSAAGTVSISATNNGGLADPAAVTLTVASAPTTLTIGATTVTADATTGVPSITTDPAPVGGKKPVYVVYRAPKGADTSGFVIASKVSALPYADTSAPCGDFDYRVTATDTSLGTTVLDGGIATATVTTVGDVSGLSVDTASHAFMTRPDGLVRLDITGKMPATQAAGTTAAVAQFSQNGHTCCTYNFAPKISGQSTASDPKAGYSGKLTNAAGKKADIKFGPWAPQSKLSLKAYYSERSLCRDIVSNRLFKQIAEFSNSATGSAFPSEALAGTSQPGKVPMGTDGFACKVYINGSYQGLYINRTSGANGDWLIDTDNTAHYFLQFDHAGAAGWVAYDWTAAFNPVFFDVAAPAMSGYSDQSDFSSTFPTEYAACSAPFDLIADIIAGTKPFSDLSTLWDLQSLINYLIASEVTANVDGIVNNAYFLNWGGKWFIYWYDLDETFGQGYLKTIDPGSYTGCVTQKGTAYGPEKSTVFDLLWTNARSELNRLYGELRNAGVLTVPHIMGLFYDFGAAFGDAELENEIAVWGTNARAPMSMVETWTAARLAYLDSVFGYAGQGVPVWQ